MLLADLKSSGKTVVVVSHDDRYFHVAGRVLQMNYGRLDDQVHDIRHGGAPNGKAGDSTNQVSQDPDR
jgi:putative ATP-binding cassette transporter